MGGASANCTNSPHYCLNVFIKYLEFISDTSSEGNKLKKNVGVSILAFGFNTEVLFRFDKLNLDKSLA